MKTAIVLLNLGGPDSKSSIKPFLFNFFTDPNIIRYPYPLRWAIARLISERRSRREAGASYGELGGKSPLLENSRAQAQALDALLNHEAEGEYKSFICMRYWHPMADEVARSVMDYNPDRIVLLPFYPQYSTTTTRSSYQVWQKACSKVGLSKESRFVCCYPFENGFVKASAENIKPVYEQAMRETGLKPRVLFSAHGLPEGIVKEGDPYQWQCVRTANAIVDSLAIQDLDWQVCYQSRVGPQKWIGPSTEEALEEAARDQRPVVILPHAFTQEHVETLVEIEIEYREKALHLGLPGFYRVSTVGTHPLFIAGLADMVREAFAHDGISPNTGTRLCPSEYGQCAQTDPKLAQLKSCRGACRCRHTA